MYPFHITISVCTVQYVASLFSMMDPWSHHFPIAISSSPYHMESVIDVRVVLEMPSSSSLFSSISQEWSLWCRQLYKQQSLFSSRFITCWCRTVFEKVKYGNRTCLCQYQLCPTSNLVGGLCELIESLYFSWTWESDSTRQYCCIFVRFYKMWYDYQYPPVRLYTIRGSLCLNV